MTDLKKLDWAIEEIETNSKDLKNLVWSYKDLFKQLETTQELFSSVIKKTEEMNKSNKGLEESIKKELDNYNNILNSMIEKNNEFIWTLPWFIVSENKKNNDSLISITQQSLAWYSKDLEKSLNKSTNDIVSTISNQNESIENIKRISIVSFIILVAFLVYFVYKLFIVQ